MDILTVPRLSIPAQRNVYTLLLPVAPVERFSRLHSREPSTQSASGG